MPRKTTAELLEERIPDERERGVAVVARGADSELTDGALAARHALGRAREHGLAAHLALHEHVVDVHVYKSELRVCDRVRIVPNVYVPRVDLATLRACECSPRCDIAVLRDEGVRRGSYGVCAMRRLARDRTVGLLGGELTVSGLRRQTSRGAVQSLVSLASGGVALDCSRSIATIRSGALSIASLVNEPQGAHRRRKVDAQRARRNRAAPMSARAATSGASSKRRSEALYAADANCMLVYVDATAVTRSRRASLTARAGDGRGARRGREAPYNVRVSASQVKHPGIVTMRRIEPGELLTASYGAEFSK